MRLKRIRAILLVQITDNWNPKFSFSGVLCNKRKLPSSPKRTREEEGGPDPNRWRPADGKNIKRSTKFFFISFYLFLFYFIYSFVYSFFFFLAETTSDRHGVLEGRWWVTKSALVVRHAKVGKKGKFYSAGPLVLLWAGAAPLTWLTSIPPCEEDTSKDHAR
jgi:hypothetical protein